MAMMNLSNFDDAYDTKKLLTAHEEFAALNRIESAKISERFNSRNMLHVGKFTTTSSNNLFHK